MSNALGYAAKPDAFHPASVSEVVGLHLARVLGDEARLRQYLDLVHEFPLASVLDAYHAATHQGSGGDDLRHRFWILLHEQVQRRSADHRSVLAVASERRSVGLAVFNGLQLDYVDFRDLVTNPTAAQLNAKHFLRSAIRSISPTEYVVEAHRDQSDTRRGDLARLVNRVAAERMLPRHEVAASAVLASCGYPPCNSRVEAREVVRQLWPRLLARTRKTAVLDAAALGLHAQVVSLFHH